MAFRGLKGPLASLGNWATIESKQQSRLWHAFLAQEIAALSHSEIRVPRCGGTNGARISTNQRAGRLKIKTLLFSASKPSSLPISDSGVGIDPSSPQTCLPVSAR